jgi:hypothetical protein
MRSPKTPPAKRLDHKDTPNRPAFAGRGRGGGRDPSSNRFQALQEALEETETQEIDNIQQGDSTEDFSEHLAIEDQQDAVMDEEDANSVASVDTEMTSNLGDLGLSAMADNPAQQALNLALQHTPFDKTMPATAPMLDKNAVYLVEGNGDNGQVFTRETSRNLEAHLQRHQNSAAEIRIAGGQAPHKADRYPTQANADKTQPNRQLPSLQEQPSSINRPIAPTSYTPRRLDKEIKLKNNAFRLHIHRYDLNLRIKKKPKSDDDEEALITAALQRFHKIMLAADNTTIIPAYLEMDRNDRTQPDLTQDYQVSSVGDFSSLKRYFSRLSSRNESTGKVYCSVILAQSAPFSAVINSSLNA